MNDDVAGLGVGFIIDTGGSFDELTRLQNAMNSAEGKLVADAANIERATGNMLNLGGSTAAVKSFGSAVTAEMRAAARETFSAEKSGEALSRQLERQISTFGMTRAAAAALRLENSGLSVQADELRAKEALLAAMHAQAAGQKQVEANAAARLAQEHANLAAKVQGAQSAMVADAAAAERMRSATDPLYAATVRLNAEIAESTRLYYAGATAPDEYARQQEVLTGRLRDVQQQHDIVNRGLGTVAGTGKLAGHHMQNLAFQFQDLGIQMAAAASSSAPLKLGFMALIQQGTQIQGIMSQAGIGIRGVGSAFVTMSKGILLAVVTNPILLGLTATIGLFAGAVSMLNRAANDGEPIKEYAKSLGLTADQIKELDNVTVTWGDTAKAVFQVAGRAIWDNIGPAVTDTWNVMKDWANWIFSGVKAAANFLIGGFVGAYHAISATWRMFPSALGDIFYSAVNSAIGAINGLIRKSVDGINSFIQSANGILSQVGLELPTISAPQIDTLANQYKGAYATAGKAAQAEMQKYLGFDYIGAVGGAIAEQARTNAKNRILNQATEKGFLDDKDGKKAREKKAQLSDAEKAYLAAVKAAREYADAQLEEAAKVGLSTKELRLYADAAAIAKAPTDALKEAIRDATAVREAAYTKQSAKEFEKNIIQPLRDELALYGLVGPARDAAGLALEKQAFIAENMDDGIVVATKRWEEYFRIKSELIAKDAAVETEELRIKRLNEALAGTAELWDALSNNVNNAAAGMAEAFGRVGAAIGDLAAIYADFQATRARGDAEHIKRMQEARTAEQKTFEVTRYGLSTSTAQLGLYGDMAAAAKGFFNEKSKGYKALMAAEKVFRAFEFAMSVKSMVQDIAETISSVANSGARATAAGAEGVATQSKLPFPFNIAAMAATAAALVAAGIAILGSPGGGGNSLPKSNTGTGTVLGDSSAQSDSIKNAISALKDVDVLMLNTSRQMAASLQNIEDNISGFASLLVRNSGSINASGGVTEGFNANAIGSVLGKIPLIGGILKGLFGTSTKVVGSGLFGGPQSLDSILNGGFDASYYSDVQKKKKFLGLTTSNKFSTQFTGADSTLENQFTLILRSFNDAIIAAAGPLGASTNEIEQRLNGFVLNIGKIDLKGLSGAQIEEKLNAVFGAAADDMAKAAFPFIEEFQKVGEGAFETLVRVASTIEAVGASLDLLGQNARGMGIAAKLGLADQFESVSALTSAVDAYFQSFYTKEEQAAARTTQMAAVFQSLGLTLPPTLSAFRALVEAQDLTSASGQATYATLLKLAPAFADLQAAMEGAKSAADIASERADLQRQLLELQGDTAALRALQLAKLDVSNRALQLQIYAIQDAQAAAKAADELRQAWKSVGDTIMDEVRRIRGLTETAGGNGFATLLGRFNAATALARGGDQDAAKSLPQLSQALLTAAAEAASSRQELDRVQAQTAASLEATFGVIAALAGNAQPVSNTDLLNAVQASQPASGSVNDNGPDSLAARFDDMRDELAQLRAENIAALATIAANTGSMKRVLDNVTSQSGGDAVSTVAAAA